MISDVLLNHCHDLVAGRVLHARRDAFQVHVRWTFRRRWEEVPVKVLRKLSTVVRPDHVPEPAVLREVAPAVSRQLSTHQSRARHDEDHIEYHEHRDEAQLHDRPLREARGSRESPLHAGAAEDDEHVGQVVGVVVDVDPAAAQVRLDQEGDALDLDGGGLGMDPAADPDPEGLGDQPRIGICLLYTSPSPRDS